jgi:2-polyprenyl-3-methyl-5-hydroxy-6-metoxy-1,4-benzoquinol methylase
MSAQARRTRVPAARFERLYEASRDPWDYLSSEYEREKYSDTLAAMPAGALSRVLEVGCSIGVFTELLAPRCAELVAIDFAARAIELASERLAGVANVELLQASFPEQIPSGEWQAIVCSEVLYYLDEPTLRRAIDWLEGQLESGASVVAVSWRGEGEEEPMRGDEAHDLLARELARWHSFDGRRPGYRLDRFDGNGR